jgi:glycosyltransferase involved in cell wall biosynthesis
MIRYINALIAKALNMGRLPCFVLSRNPSILVAFWDDLYGCIEGIRARLPEGRKTYVLCQLGWQCETSSRVQEVMAQVSRFREQIDRVIELIFMCNSVREEEQLRSGGLVTLFCNQNAFLDEARYPVDTTAKKDYDALYVARITPFKRHDLAASISRLCLIGLYTPSEKDYAERMLSLLSHAKWVRSVPAWEIPEYCARSHCGLCLSQEEGAMFVSAEYLLCGIPIVSTPSIGGRDVFFGEPYTTIVEAHPEAVSGGVQELIQRKVDPQEIRREALSRIAEHRRRFLLLLQDIYLREGVRFDIDRAWDLLFVHKLGVRTTVSPLVAATRLLRKPRTKDCRRLDGRKPPP